MTTAEIKALPKEFNFKSNINHMGLTYHAVEEEHCYVVTHNDSRWVYDKKEFRRNLLNDDFVVLKNTVFEAMKEMNIDEMVDFIVAKTNHCDFCSRKDCPNCTDIEGGCKQYIKQYLESEMKK